MQGTEDWVPAHVYEEEILGSAARQKADDQQRRRQMLHLAAAESAAAKKEIRSAAVALTWGGIGGLFVGLALSASTGSMICLVCGVLLLMHRHIGRGLVFLVSGIALFPLVSVYWLVWQRVHET